MDSIFAGDASSHAAGPEPEVALPEVALPAPAPMPAPEDVPLIFRQPTVEEVREAGLKLWKGLGTFGEVERVSETKSNLLLVCSM